ncbi:unnamed protein product [Blepharisma stoltei]|uniref:Uncharacterized protein n=1 Tax=Blepharisma stoltei TaxID=1481888 RepID=A0AAU9I8V3_9CILI|nr:unnamed protein product [Blepharisma stoltei]
MELSDGEDLSDSEMIDVSVDFLKFKATNVIDNLKELIPFNMTDGYGRTLLHWASYEGKIKKVKFLVENAMQDLSLRDFSGFNALELAAKRGHSKVIDFLSEAGLECRVVDPNLRLNPDVSLLREGQIAAAIYADNLEELRLKFEGYVTNINGWFSLPEFYEYTLVGISCWQLSPKCLEWLISKGAMIKLENNDGSKPLDNCLEALLGAMPPESEEEFIQVNTGIECLIILLDRIKDYTPYLPRLRMLFARSRNAGKGSSTAGNDYEREVINKLIRMGLLISKYV